MHLAVVSLARTGSTVLAQVLAKKFDLKLLGEIYNSNFPDPIYQLGEISARTHWVNLHQGTESVTKIMGHNLLNEQQRRGRCPAFQEVPWDQFDRILFTTRQNFPDCVASVGIANIRKKWHHQTDTPDQLTECLPISESHYRWASYEYYAFLKARQKLMATLPEKCISVPYEIFSYDSCHKSWYLSKLTGWQFAPEHFENTRNRSHGFVYPLLCDNYRQIIDWCQRDYGTWCATSISADLIEPHLPDWGFQTIPD